MLFIVRVIIHSEKCFFFVFCKAGGEAYCLEAKKKKKRERNWRTKVNKAEGCSFSLVVVLYLRCTYV